MESMVPTGPTKRAPHEVLWRGCIRCGKGVKRSMGNTPKPGGSANKGEHWCEVYWSEHPSGSFLNFFNGLESCGLWDLPSGHPIIQRF